MKIVKLKSLTLRNFKRLTDLKIRPGENTVIRGQNGTGKTTVYDAFCWLLTGKDSLGRSDFDLKTISPVNGETQHGLEYEVEGVLDVDGTELTLSKIFSEKWTRKRGTTKTEFTGHSTQHFIDTIPISESEYRQRVGRIADEKTFRLLTSTHFFNDEKQFSWQDRRRMLLEVCGGEIDQAAIIGSNPALAEIMDVVRRRLPAIENMGPIMISGREALKKVIKAQQKKLNEERDKIPVRIDEVTRSLPDTLGLIEDAEKAALESIDVKLSSAKTVLAQVLDGGAIIQKRNELAQVETDLIVLKNKLRGGIQTEIDGLLAKKATTIFQSNNAKNRINNVVATCDRHQANVKRHEADRVALRDRWHTVNNEVYAEPEIDTICPACGQDLPVEKVQAARDNAQRQFNVRKAKDLQAISDQGKTVKTAQEAIESEIMACQAEKIEAESALRGLEQEKTYLEESLNALQKKLDECENAPESVALTVKLNAIVNEIIELQTGVAVDTAPLRERIRIFEEEKTEVQGRLDKIKNVRDGQARIEELKAQETKLACELERLQKELFLLELYEKTEAGMLEGKINSRFQLAKFKLFDEAINGGITPTCKTTYEGVQWDRGLNPGYQTNVGRDIINVLSEHYGVSLPCFADNAESVTELLPSPAQTIRIIHDPDCKKLTIKGEAK